MLKVAKGFPVLHHRLCILQCDWWREISLQKVINFNEAQRDRSNVTRPSPLVNGVCAQD